MTDVHVLLSVPVVVVAAHDTPSLLPPAFRLTVMLLTVADVVLVRKVKKSVLVAEKLGPKIVEDASMPSPKVTIGVVEETAEA